MLASPPIQLDVLGWSDSLILMVMALVVFGPRRLPQIGRQIGKLMYELRKASNDFKFQMEEELRMSEESDRRKTEEERLRAMAAAAPAPEFAPEPVVIPEYAVPSPYPGEDSYPAPNDPAGPAEAGESTEAGEPAEAGTLSVKPPSEGETVAATHPFLEPAQHGDAAQSAALVEDPPAGEVPATETPAGEANHG